MTQETNPYRPPASQVESTLSNRSPELASKGRRFGTFVIDYIGFMVFGFVVGLVAGLVFGDAGINAMQSMPDFVLGLILISCYYLFFEGIWARTPGKLIFGTIVLDEKGDKPSVGAVIKRTLCRFIPFEPFSFFGQRGWHDSISKTQVVLKRTL